jgi:hypothetical protein
LPEEIREFVALVLLEVEEVVLLEIVKVFGVHCDAKGGSLIWYFLEVVELSEVRYVRLAVPHRQILRLHRRIVLYEFVWGFLEIYLGPLSHSQLLWRIAKSVLH